MTTEEWEIFVNEGVTSNKLIVSIAYKIYKSIELDDKEMSVYMHNSGPVEDTLQKIKLLENVRT